jgi:signal peptidase II
VSSLSLIFAGALGNIIDSTFYGMIFSASTPFQKAVLFPPEGGYAKFVPRGRGGHVLLPALAGAFPAVVARCGAAGRSSSSEPVFNVADAAITVGVVMFILIQGRTSPDEGEVRMCLPSNRPYRALRRIVFPERPIRRRPSAA